MQTLARFLKKKLITDPQAMEKLDRFFASRKGRVRTPNNDRQAQLVEGSLPLQNPAGLAVGGMIEDSGVTYVVLPGPPTELKAMFTQSLEPLLMKDKQQLYSRVLRFFGIGESQLVTILSDLIEEQTDPTVAPYAKTGEVTLRLSTKARVQEEADAKLDNLETTIVEREALRSFLYGYGENNSLAQVVAELLEQEQLSISFLEQLTAGVIQSQLSLVLKSKNSYRGGVILPQLKADMDELVKHVQRIRRKQGSDIALGLCLELKPQSQIDTVMVRVYLALEWGKKKMVEEMDLSGYSWQHVQELASLYVLDLIRKTLLNSKTLL